MAGAAGTEWYMGLEDLTVENFRTRERMWDLTKISLDFFKKIPFASMKNRDKLIISNNAWCFSKEDEIYVLYLLEGKTVTIDFPEDHIEYSLTWFNPRTGATIKKSEHILSGRKKSIGPPPSDMEKDWVILLKKIPEIN